MRARHHSSSPVLPSRTFSLYCAHQSPGGLAKRQVLSLDLECGLTVHFDAAGMRVTLWVMRLETQEVLSGTAASKLNTDEVPEHGPQISSQSLCFCEPLKAELWLSSVNHRPHAQGSQGFSVSVQSHPTEASLWSTACWVRLELLDRDTCQLSDKDFC